MTFLSPCFICPKWGKYLRFCNLNHLHRDIPLQGTEWCLHDFKDGKIKLFLEAYPWKSWESWYSTPWIYVLKLTVALFLTAFFFFFFLSEGKGVLNHKFCWFSSSVWFFPCSSPTKSLLHWITPEVQVRQWLTSWQVIAGCQGQDSDPHFWHSWSCVGDKVPAKLLKNNILNVI